MMTRVFFAIFIMAGLIAAGTAISLKETDVSSPKIFGGNQSNESINKAIDKSTPNLMMAVPGGISDPVHQIIEARKNGSISVPQGMLVRIIAHNHTLSIENESALLNETLVANLTINGKNKSFIVKPHDQKVNITDGNVTVETNESLEIANGSFMILGKKVLVMPSEVPSKIKTKTIKSAVLHVVGGMPEYEINATRNAKVLWIFDSQMDVEVTLDAETGKIKSENRPWWSFLAGVQEG